MGLDLNLLELSDLMLRTAKVASTRILVELGHLSPYISQREAYRRFGQANVKRWVKQGLLDIWKDGNNTSTIRIDRSKLESLSQADNRLHNIYE